MFVSEAAFPSPAAGAYTFRQERSSSWASFSLYCYWVLLNLQITPLLLLSLAHNSKLRRRLL
jgi:hypothetical protein